MVVEGPAIAVSTPRTAADDTPPNDTALNGTASDDPAQRYAYAETFVVGAAAQDYVVSNTSDQPVQLLVSFLKAKDQWPAWMKELR